MFAQPIFAPRSTPARYASVHYRATVEAVFGADPAGIGILLNPPTDGRVFGPPFGIAVVTARIDRYLHVCLHRLLFGVEMHFGDGRPVARLAGPA